MTTHKDHKHHAMDEAGSARVVVITVSDTRTATSDKSGALLRETLSNAGYKVEPGQLVHDEKDEIRSAILGALHQGARAVILTGGTGLAPRDVTPEVVRELLHKELPGFGELFRQLSFAEIGAAAMLSRTLAGSRDNAFIVCLPGSSAAVRLAAEKLLVPQLRHILGLLAG